MHQVFEITRTSRKVLAQFLEQYTLEQLNKIPEGFKNNLIWNIGHCIVVQQMLVYKLSGLPMMISEELFEKYRKGTQPESDVSPAELEELKRLLFETINQTKTDVARKIFKSYDEFTSLSGFTMRNVEDAIAFNYYHEAMHIGMMMSIRKFI